MGNAKSSNDTDCERGVAWNKCADDIPSKSVKKDADGVSWRSSNPPFPLPILDS